jgi:multidrug efflux pump subunit AcrA (membrane-fusion protein)
VLRRHVNIGDHVEAGQLLAEIATPEVDAEVSQTSAELLGAEATLESVKANANLAEINAQRYRRLIKNVAASQQMLDDAEAALLVANAKVKLPRRRSRWRRRTCSASLNCNRSRR